MLRKAASSSFERVSQEIEKASQELPQARQSLSNQQGVPGNAPAQGWAPWAEQSAHSAAQRAPLDSLKEPQQQGQASQEIHPLSSQQTGSAVSRGSTQSISEAGRLPPSRQNMQRPVSRDGSRHRQPSAELRARIQDAGHIVAACRQGGYNPSQQRATQQRSQGFTARGLRASASQQEQPSSSTQQASQRGPQVPAKDSLQRQQHASQPPARLQGSVLQPQDPNRGRQPPQGPHGAAPAQARHQQTAHAATQGQHWRQSQPATQRLSHAPSRPASAQDQTSTHGPGRQHVSVPQAQQQVEPAMQSSGVSGKSKQGSAMQAASQAAAAHPQSSVTLSHPQSRGLPSSQQPLQASSSQHPCTGENTGVFANSVADKAAQPGHTGENTGVFADDDNDDEDDDWDAEVVKLLESAALSRPSQQPQQAHAQV